MTGLAGRVVARVLVSGLCLWSLQAQAVLTIEITEGADTGLPIAVVPFAWSGSGAMPQDVSSIVKSDLARSGRFQTLNDKDFISRPHDDKSVDFKDWRLIKAEALLIGSVSAAAGKRYQVEYRLYDVFKKTQLAGYRYLVDADLLRTAAHQISDVVYEKLTGEPGAFSTRLAYVTLEGRGKSSMYRLQIADSDGYGPVTAVKSKEPLLSPSWSPDGTRIAYVSFERRRAMVYVQNVSNGQRQRVAGFEGINSAPAWSPDGTRLALTLSRDGNAEIYLMDMVTRQLTRLTRHGAIDTEPAWSPDGRQIAFTSDRAGRPQVYRMDVESREVQRLTFEGSYNARPSWSPDGKFLTLVSRLQGRYHIAVLRLDNLALQVLTDTSLDESPSYAPNGRMLIYATEVKGRGVLASVSSDGRVRQTFRFDQGDVREPAWSPFNRKMQVH